jgi:predicted metal-dependent RNase
MRLRNLTRRLEIGANSYLFESAEGYRFVIDAGMHPKAEGRQAMPDFDSVPPDSVDSILLSHAHHDHLGALPLLQRSHPNTPVFMTEFTGEISDAMLHNSVNVMTKQREAAGLGEMPFFTHREVESLRRMWTYVELKRTFELPDSNIECRFHDACHIVGSAGIQISEGGKSLLYTGDVNFESQTICLPADFPKKGIDVLIMETTRGDYQRPAEYSRRLEKERLGRVICETYERGGSVLIPVFALGKTQEVMVMLHELYLNDLIPEMPLFIGGLSTKITVLHDKYCRSTRRNYPNFMLLDDIDLLVPSSGRRRREIVNQPKCIFALSSGMMSKKTTSNGFAQTFLDNPRNTIAFVGYTDPESPGYKVRHAKPGQQVVLDADKPPVVVNARVESFDFSAHAPREDLLDYAVKLKPKKIVLVHGDEPAQLWFEGQFKTQLPNTEIVRPFPGTWFDLW